MEDAERRGVTQGIPSHVEPLSLDLRREDLVALRLAYQRESRGPRQWIGMIVGIGGLAVGVAAMALVEPLGMAPVMEPVFLGLGWSVLLAAFGAAKWRDHKMLRRWQLPCPACQKPLLESDKGASAMTKVDLVIASGRCQHCGELVLAP